MAKSVTSFRNKVEVPFTKSTSGTLASLSDQFSWLLDLQGYLWVAWDSWIIWLKTKELAKNLEGLDGKISRQEKLTKEDYMIVVHALIDLIEDSFLNEKTKIETLRKAILLRILEDQDLHHKITSAFSVVEVLSILISVITYSVNCHWIAPVVTTPLLVWPYVQYKASEPLHDYRKELPKNYQLQIKHLEMEEANRKRSPILHIVYLIAFNVSILLVPYTLMEGNVGVNKTVEEIKSRAWKAVDWNINFKEVIKWPYFLLLGLLLEMLAVYLFIFQAKRNQKTMAKRTWVLLPYLEKLPEKNKEFFLQTLDALKTFKQSLSEIETPWNQNEKDFYRLIDTLNDSLSRLEQDADPEIKKLFKQTTELIAKIKGSASSVPPLDTWTYRLLEFVRVRARGQTQNLPSKWKVQPNWWDDTTEKHWRNDGEWESNETRLRLIQGIKFPRRMKQLEAIKFLEFIGWTRQPRKWSHFSYEVHFEWSKYSIVLSDREEYFGDVLRDWIVNSWLSPEFVLRKWEQYNAK